MVGSTKAIGSSSSWFDIIVAKNASFAVHWEVMCGCASAGVDVDKDGQWQSVAHHAGTTLCARG